MNSGLERACERESVEVTPCVIKTSATSVAAVCMDRMSRCASDLVVPIMQSLERRESSGTR